MNDKVNTRSHSMLALDGGDAVRTTELPPWPVYEADEIHAATDVLKSGKVNYWTGDECRKFEREFAAYHGVQHAVALANGTVALELALRVLGIGVGHEVIVTPRSYFASAGAVQLAGAMPVFADIDRDSQNLTPETIQCRISDRSRAILVVHLAGWPCDMPAIMSLAKRHKLSVIEDCAQAHGARIDGRPVGSFGNVSAYSFCQDKIMSTAGEGGMLLTNDDTLWEAAWSFKDHGKNYRSVIREDHPPGFRWLHDSVGTNWRMTELQAAIGRVQLGKLDHWVEIRRANAERLMEGLSDIGCLRIPRPSSREYHSWYKLHAFVRPERLRKDWSRDRILEAIAAEGVPGLSGSCPEIYRERAFAHHAWPTLESARELGQTSLMFLVHPTLGTSDIDDMIMAIRKVLSAAAA